MVPPGSSIHEPPSSLQPATQPALLIPPGPPIDSLERLSRHSFSLSTIYYVVGSVLASSLSILSTIRTLDFFFPEQARQGFIPHPTSGRMWLLRLGYYRLHELIVRVEYECSKVPSGRRMAGTTEILESSYGKLKIVEGSQSESGFTSLVLVWAALFGTTTMNTLKAAMVTTPTKLVHRWVCENLGLTVQSKRTQLARIVRLNLTEKQQDT